MTADRRWAKPQHARSCFPSFSRKQATEARSSAAELSAAAGGGGGGGGGEVKCRVGPGDQGTGRPADRLPATVTLVESWTLNRLMSLSVSEMFAHSSIFCVGAAGRGLGAAEHWFISV